MTILGISGAIGSGKSWTQLRTALEYCDRKKKRLVTNFEINPDAVLKYAKSRNYDYVQNMILRDRYTYIINPRRRVSKGLYEPCVDALLIPESVVALDECGIYLNSRNFAKTSFELLADLCQSRKTGTDIVWAAQFNDQVDRQFRMLTQYWVHCNSVSMWCNKMRRPKLVYKKIYWFKDEDYNFWLQNVKDRTSHFRTRFAYAFLYEGGFLSATDKMVFGMFNSFDRLDVREQRDHVRAPSCDIFQPGDVKIVSSTTVVRPPKYLPHPPEPPHRAQLGGGRGSFLPPFPEPIPLPLLSPLLPSSPVRVAGP